MLFKEGRLLGEIHVLGYKLSDEELLPFGAVSLTQAQRLVFWPVVPARFVVATDRGPGPPIDHVTLELSNGKTHATWYEQNGKRLHRSQGWRLHRFGDSGLSLWMILGYRRSVLLEQPRNIEWEIPRNLSDSARRIEDFGRLPPKIRVVPVALPAVRPSSDVLLSMIYVADSASAWKSFTNDMFDVREAARWVKGWPDGDVFLIQLVRHQIGSTHVVIATCRPPGELQDEVAIGFPRRTAGGRG